MKIPHMYNLLIAIVVLIEAVNCIHVEKVVVPSPVIGGKRVELQCLYREEGDELYSLKWWKGEDQFYQFIPPKRSYYSIPGVKVNMEDTYLANGLSAPGLERVILEPVGLDTAGIFRCEVMADKIFQTVSKQANMTVIYPPSGSPEIAGLTNDQTTIFKGQRISLVCSSPPSNPSTTLLWMMENQPVSDYNWVIVTPLPNINDRGYLKVGSRLEFLVTEEIMNRFHNGLAIVCEAQQNISSYRNTSTIILYPERPSYFWFFSSGNTFPSSMFAIVGTIVLLQLVAAYLLSL